MGCRSDTFSELFCVDTFGRTTRHLAEAPRAVFWGGGAGGVGGCPGRDNIVFNRGGSPYSVDPTGARRSARTGLPVPVRSSRCAARYRPAWVPDVPRLPRSRANTRSGRVAP
jgi:hypothetical protein